MNYHLEYMREAIRLADTAVKNGNQPFGSVLVRGSEIVLRAENTIYTGHDITNHAEMNLVRMAVHQYDAQLLSECTLYASTEPCAMCSGAIYWSGIGRVVYGCSAERLYRLAGGGLHLPCKEVLGRGVCKIEVVGPFLEDEAVQSHTDYWRT